MMKFVAGLVILFLLSCGVRGEGRLFEKLRQIKEISDIQKMDVGFFDEYYQFWFEQPVDHANPDGAKFKQKVLLGHKGDKAPVVVELQGYNIWTPEAGELAHILNGNQLTIEHRFFDKSVPEGGILWDYLTIKQAADDQHEIIQAVKKAVYGDSKWVSTGISKGGQTTIFHRYFYPEDVDVSVPYVAPLNLEYVDPRLERFFEKVGTKECRWDIHDFQVFCFKNIDKIVALVDKTAQEKQYTFEMAGGVKRAVQLMILEFPFAFWQWNGNCNEIPNSEMDEPEELYNFLLKVSGPDFFEDHSIKQQQPFFYGALTEMGMYDYKVKPFKKYLPADKENITFAFTMPEGVKQKPFNAAQMQKINEWLQTDAKKMLFIYGGIDPWGATAVELGGNEDCRKYVRGDMNHGCRIKHFEEVTQQDIKNTLKEWLK